MVSLFTLKNDLGCVKTIYYLNAVLGRYLFAGIVEFLTFVAPIKICCVTNNLRRGNGSINTLSAHHDLRDLDTLNLLNGDEESVIVKALKLKRVLSFTNTVGLRKTFTLEFLGKKSCFLKDLSLCHLCLLLNLLVLLAKLGGLKEIGEISTERGILKDIWGPISGIDSFFIILFDSSLLSGNRVEITLELWEEAVKT